MAEAVALHLFLVAIFTPKIAQEGAVKGVDIFAQCHSAAYLQMASISILKSLEVLILLRHLLSTVAQRVQLHVRAAVKSLAHS